MLSCFDLGSITLSNEDEWYFLAVDSRGQLKIFDKEWTKKSISKTSRLSLGNSGVQIGDGFKGSIKHVTMLSKTYDSDDEIKNIAFQYLPPGKDLLMELTLDNARQNSGIFD